MTSVGSNFLCGRPRGADPSTSTCVHLSVTPPPLCGRLKWIALTKYTIQGRHFSSFQEGEKISNDPFLIIYTKIISKFLFIQQNFPTTYFRHLHLNSYLSIQTCTQICLVLQSHHFGKCSHVIFEHQRLCHLILIHSILFSYIFSGGIFPPVPQMTSLPPYLKLSDESTTDATILENVKIIYFLVSFWESLVTVVFCWYNIKWVPVGLDVYWMLQGISLSA